MSQRAAMRYVVLPITRTPLRALNVSQPSVADRPAAGPTRTPADPDTWLRWREQKLARYPRRVEDLIVEVRDPRQLRPSELGELHRLCHVANMAVYASPAGARPDKDLPRRVGEQLGLHRLQANLLADEDGISTLETSADKAARGYIPYSTRRMHWHTDGYYNAPASSIRAFILHCVRPAESGGANRLLDHEMAWLRLRDADPAYVDVLSAPDAMTIPANVVDGVSIRPVRSGPVFSGTAGALHMRYTARTQSVEWRADAATRAAVAQLNAILDSDASGVFTLRLAAGQGLVCNNVLHDRSAYTDGTADRGGRLVYRARYTDRVAPHADH